MERIGFSAVAECLSENWSPVIGDPTVLGWMTVAYYALAVIACFAAALASRQDFGFWLFLTVVLVFLGINKQLDLQTALTVWGRCDAQLNGWYDNRRAVQGLFIILLLSVSLAVFLTALLRLRKGLMRIGVALTGFGLLVTFVAVRAVGFHHFDSFISASVGSMSVNGMLELGGIILILTNAYFAISGARRRSANIYRGY